MESLSSGDFENGRLRREGTWLVAFLADWCPFCRRFRPTFAVVDGGSTFRTRVADVTSESSELWEMFEIDVVPTVLVFREGAPVVRVDSIPGFGLPPGGLEHAVAAARREPSPS